MTIYSQPLSFTSERQRCSRFGIQEALSSLLSFSILALFKNGMEINRPDAITIMDNERHRIIPSCLFICCLIKNICVPPKIYLFVGCSFKRDFLQNFTKEFLLSADNIL